MPASSVSVLYPGMGVGEADPTGLQIVREEYRHDIAAYSTALNTAKPYHRAGTPMRIDWAQGRDVSSFYGYVHHIEPMAGTGKQRVWCRGASEVLDNGVQSVFRNRTVPALVREAARLAHLDAEVVDHGRVFDTITAPGGRLFDLLVEQAQEIGYSFYCHNTRMALHPRLFLVERLLSEAPVLRLGRAESLLEFVPQDGHAPVGKQRVERVVSGYDASTGSRFSVVGGVAAATMGRTFTLPTGRHYVQGEVSSPVEARWKLAAMAENDRFSITAKATGLGVPSVSQTWPVLLTGVGERYEGAWFVRKVTHRPLEPVYTMELELGRDATGSVTDIPGPRAKRVLATRNNPQGRPRAIHPPSVLADSRWRAQWSASSRSFNEPSRRVRR